MTNNVFIVDNLKDLRVLQRIFREAKFSKDADDLEISPSPLVASLFQKLMDALIAEDILQNGQDAGTRWHEWLEINDSRDEWEAALNRAKNSPYWYTFTEAERIDFVITIFSPFIISSDLIQRFIFLVNEQFIKK